MLLAENRRFRNWNGITRVTVRSFDDGHTGTQIDLLIMRADNVVNLCEMKFASTPYSIDKDEAEKLQVRIDALKQTLSAKQTVHLTMVTTFGAAYGKHSGIVQRQVMMDDLFV